MIIKMLCGNKEQLSLFFISPFLFISEAVLYRETLYHVHNASQQGCLERKIGTERATNGKANFRQMRSF